MTTSWFTRGSALLFLLLAEPLAASAAQESQLLADPGSDSFELTSQFTGSTYQIAVSLPAAYGSAAPGETFPVIYVLDGQWLFPTASWVAVGGLFDRSMPPAIVVGISWKAPHDVMMVKRERDFMPFAVKQMPEAGHAAEFRRFLSEELIPAIGGKYKAGPVRALAGLSLGGLFTVDTLVSDPDLFDIYIADSPSLGFDDGSLRRRFDSLPANFLHKPTRLYLSWGGAEALVASARSYSRELERRQFKYLRFRGEPVGHVGHAVSGVEAIAEGLVFGFSRDAVPLSAARLKEYAGRYVSADGKVATRIKVATSGLTINFSNDGAPANDVPLKAIGDDHLIAEANFIEIWFQRDAENHVNGAHMVNWDATSDLIRADSQSDRQPRTIPKSRN
jgi:predicted alpha/beta superfamily hydrolase